MHSKLARILIARGIIQRGTVIQAYRKVRGLSCVCNSEVVQSFVVNSVSLVNGTNVVFDTIGPDQFARRLDANDVVMLDGMAIDRVAISQNLSITGDELPMRSRRGRRPKPRMAAAS